MVDLILKKRAGLPLSPEEIQFFISGVTSGDIADYQTSALLMAICFRGMTQQEASDLTFAMANSGDTLDLSGVPGVKVDKHSTGGVGDKTTLILAPLVASFGIPVAKMSGRGLGHTGGTIDKLESIPGFNTNLSADTFLSQVRDFHLALAGQTGNLTPADKKLYALRDVTGTVESLPLIASSVMSKKVASGADAIVLDVKFGRGAFMKNVHEARALARLMVDIGNQLGRRTTALLTDMNEPLGYAIGNSLEVLEAIDVLKGTGPRDLSEVSIMLAANMVTLAKPELSIDDAIAACCDKIFTGEAINTFYAWVLRQGGFIDQLPHARIQTPVYAPKEGYVTSIDSSLIGLSSMQIGAGRATKEDVIDYSSGIVLCKKYGEFVKTNEPIAILHSSNPPEQTVLDMVAKAFSFNKVASEEKSLLIHDIIR
jgi:pyrimidine-nucleoside phosphorylase